MNHPKIYRRRTVGSILKTVIKVIACVLVAVCVLFVGLFFYLRRFAVYDENGAHLDFTKQTETVEPVESAVPPIQ